MIDLINANKNVLCEFFRRTQSARGISYTGKFNGKAINKVEDII